MPATQFFIRGYVKHQPAADSLQICIVYVIELRDNPP